MTDTTYLVPYDFSPVAACAKRYAFKMIEATGGRVELLHVVATDAGKKQAREQLGAVVARMEKEQQYQTACTVVVGNIFEDINKVAEKGKATIVVMGTHGADALQKLLGSNAIRVITSSHIPFFVTQSRYREGEIARIVLPVGLLKRSTEIVDYAAVLAEKFKAEVILVGQNEGDQWLAGALEKNVLLSQERLTEQGIGASIKLLPKGDFANELIHYSQGIKADLIAVAYIRESVVPKYDDYVQTLITNKPGIPVLTINTETVKGI